MQAGKMDTLISIERPTSVPDPVYGTETIVWVAVATRIWAEVQDALPSKSEAVTMGLNVARAQTRIRMRWRDDVRIDQRVTVHRDTDIVMQIVGGPADIDGRKSMIEIQCEKYTS